METDRYTVIVVNRETGKPQQIVGDYEGEMGAEKAHQVAGSWMKDGTHAAFVVGLRRARINGKDWS